MNQDEIHNMRKYKLKAADVSDEKLPQRGKKRDTKAGEKAELKDEKT